MRRSLAAVLVLVSSGTVASAEPQPMMGHLRGMPPALLVGAFGGGHSGGRGPRGFFFGADTGWAWLAGGTDVAVRGSTELHTSAWCFGARAGYQLPSGLAVQVRTDHLGVTAPDASGSLSTVSAGVRYGLPSEIEPFAEAMIGPAIHGSSVSPGAELGLGLSVLASRHVTFDLVGRDWLVDLGGVRHVPSVTFGITAGFGG